MYIHTIVDKEASLSSKTLCIYMNSEYKIKTHVSTSLIPMSYTSCEYIVIKFIDAERQHVCD